MVVNNDTWTVAFLLWHTYFFYIWDITFAAILHVELLRIVNQFFV